LNDKLKKPPSGNDPADLAAIDSSSAATDAQ
jgi:hypothetical protein